MNLDIDRRYAKLAGINFELYDVKSETPLLLNFRCPYCGDSQKSKHKARGYFYEIENTVNYKCHNCGISTTLRTFLYEQQSQIGMNALLRDYIFESFGDYHPKQSVPKPTPRLEKNVKKSTFEGILNLLELPGDHIAVKYVTERRIPKAHHDRLYYTDDFFNMANKFIPGKFDDDMPKDKRLLIPFFNADKNLVAFQGRALSTVETRYRYYTIAINKSEPLMFGLDRINFNDTVYVVEGPIDSLFLPNAIGLAKLQTKANFLKNNTVFVYDFEPRHKDVTKELRRKIVDGYKVCMMPKYITDYYKDINDLALGGYDTKTIKDLVDKHTFQGDLAMLEYTQWNKS